MENTLSTPNEVANLKKMVNDLQEQMKAMSTKLNLDKDIFNSEEASAFLGITLSQLYKLTHFQQIMGGPVFKPAKLFVLVKNKQAMRARFFFWGKGLRGSMPLNPLMKQQAV